MSIKQKLYFLLSIIFILVLIGASFLTYNILNLKENTTSISISLESLEKSSSIRLMLNRKSKEIMDYIVSEEEEETDEYKRHNAILNNYIIELEKHSNDNFSHNPELFKIILENIEELKIHNLILDNLALQAFELVEEGKKDSAILLLVNDISPLIFDKIYRISDYSLSYRNRLVEDSHDKLLSSLSIFPWIQDDIDSQLRIVGIEIDKLLLSDKIRSLIGRQLTEMMRYLVDYDEKEKLKFYNYTTTINSLTEDWRQLKLLGSNKNELSKNLENYLRIKNNYKRLEERFNDIFDKSNSKEDIFEIIEEKVEVTFDKRIRPDFEESISLNLSKIKSLHANIEQLATTAIIKSIAGSTLFIILIFVIVFNIIRGMLRSISLLTSGITKINTGNLKDKIKLKSNDEFNEVASALNSMSLELDKSITRIKSSESYLSSILSNIDDLVFVVDKDYNIQFVNSVTTSILGENNWKDKRHSLFSKIKFGILHENGEIQNYLNEENISDVKLNNNTTALLEIKEKSYPVLLSISQLSIDGEENSGFIFIFRDITNLRELRNKLIEQERYASIGKLAAMVSHELRNPLGTIRSSAYVIGQKTADKDLGIEKTLERLERNTLRCDKIIEDLHDYMRQKDLELFDVDIDRWVSKILNDFKENGYKISSSLNYKKELKVDKEQLNRVFINLIENAKQAIEESGKDMDGIQEHINISTKEINDGIEIVISDKGPGIAEENIQKIFEPLYSTKSFGLGIGLSIVKQIVEKHNGSIECKSTVGVGTDFIITLPN